MFQLLNNADDVQVDHNTFVYAPEPVFRHTALVLDGDKPSRLVFTNNVSEGTVAVPGKGGTDGLNQGVNGWTMAGNVLAMSAFWANLHPAGNYYPGTFADIGLRNWLSGDVRLGALSSYRGKATDGSDPGVDYAKLLERTSGVVLP
jgi:hypothetical protein